MTGGTRAALSILFALAAVGVGLWTAVATSRNFARGRALDRQQRRFEAERTALDQLRREVRAAELRLLEDLELEKLGEAPARQAQGREVRQ